MFQKHDFTYRIISGKILFGDFFVDHYSRRITQGSGEIAVYKLNVEHAEEFIVRKGDGILIESPLPHPAKGGAFRLDPAGILNFREILFQCLRQRPHCNGHVLGSNSRRFLDFHRAINTIRLFMKPVKTDLIFKIG